MPLKCNPSVDFFLTAKPNGVKSVTVKNQESENLSLNLTCQIKQMKNYQGKCAGTVSEKQDRFSPV